MDLWTLDARLPKIDDDRQFRCKKIERGLRKRWKYCGLPQKIYVFPTLDA